MCIGGRLIADFVAGACDRPAVPEVAVEGYQAKDGALRANGREITFADGRKLFVGSQGTGAPGDEPAEKKQ